MQQLIRKIHLVFKSQGLSGLWRAIFTRLFRARRLALRGVPNLFRAKLGLEVGGPSPSFGRWGLLPVYTTAGLIDNCNFGKETAWEGTIREGLTFRFSPLKPPGRQYVAEATDLSAIPSEFYDFLLSSHTIEHTGNPIKALREWIRVVKPGGLFVIIVPHRDGTFDHRRPTTSLAHLIEDFERGTTEADLTHLEEILSLHDLSRDPEAGDIEAFAARGRRNFENRCLHHHVFDTRSAVDMIHHAGLQIVFVQALAPHDIVILARKLSADEVLQNQAFLCSAPAPPWRSVFSSDQAACTSA
jgi:SAM-dependent methyltransferase